MNKLHAIAFKFVATMHLDIWVIECAFALLTLWIEWLKNTYNDNKNKNTHISTFSNANRSENQDLKTLSFSKE